MADLSEITEHMEVFGADGVFVGTVDHVDGNRIKLTKAETGPHAGHHHYISGDLVELVDDDEVRLSIDGAEALGHEEEEDGSDVED